MSDKIIRTMPNGIHALMGCAAAVFFLSMPGCESPDKRTCYLEKTPPEVKRLLDSDSGYIYLDVRTVEEFAAGHVPGAWNIPVLVRDGASSGLTTNDRFLPVVKANLSKGDRLVVGCRSGKRSAKAVQLMRQAGFTHLINMAGGFAGAKDEAGGVAVPGWSMLKYPTERGDGGNRGYAILRARVDEPGTSSTP